MIFITHLQETWKIQNKVTYSSTICCCSVTKSCLTLCKLMDCSTAGLPVPPSLLEFAQVHVHWVCDAIEPYQPQPPPSFAFNLAQHQGLFQWVSSLHQVAKVLELQLQHHSLQWVFRADFLWEGLVGSPCCPRNPQESSPALQLESINSSALNLLYVKYPLDSHKRKFPLKMNPWTKV